MIRLACSMTTFRMAYDACYKQRQEEQRIDTMKKTTLGIALIIMTAASLTRAADRPNRCIF
jgi:hypothetical protein